MPVTGRSDRASATDGSTSRGKLNNLGVALRGVRRFDEAITAHQQAAALFTELGDRHGEAGALDSLGGALPWGQASGTGDRQRPEACAASYRRQRRRRLEWDRRRLRLPERCLGR
jgi:hypothetical protein